METDSNQPIWPQRIAVSKHGMIATQQFEATNACVEILEEGGNAIDAAVAAAFAVGVCEPMASGLGGQTMMLIYVPQLRKTLAIDGSSRAPSRAVIEDFTKKEIRLIGHRATTVPSTPAVLGYVLKTYGTLPLVRVLEPAIRLAEKGYPITELQHALQIREKDNWENGNAARFFLKDGNPYPVGAVFKQPVLAETLRRIGQKEIEEFYQGEMAAQIEDDMFKHEGFVRRDDLAKIPYPIERRPISCRLEGYRVMTFPPPAAGRTLIEMLNILGQFQPKKYNPNLLMGTLLLIETIRRAQLDRRDRPFDPNFYPQVQDRRMLSEDYAKLAGKQIQSRMKKGSGETTHLSVMDAKGTVVALTQSIERVYGAFVVNPELGFLYNNYMSAFEYKDITHPYYLRANGVPWASVAPTIIFKGKKPYLTIGSPGSERIASAILQVLIRLLDGQPPLEAVSAPRVHCSVGGKVSLEAARIRDDLIPFLERRGFTIDRRKPISFYLGCVQMVLREGKKFIGVADPRRDGGAGGPLKLVKKTETS